MTETKRMRASLAPEILDKAVSVSFDAGEFKPNKRDLFIWNDHDVTPYSEWKPWMKEHEYKAVAQDGSIKTLQLQKPMGGMNTTALPEDNTSVSGYFIDIRFYETSSEGVICEMDANNGDYGLTLSEGDVENMYKVFSNLAKDVVILNKNGSTKKGFELPSKVLYTNRSNNYSIWNSKA
ncbi:MAG TPA: hypothetical protein VKC53_04185 [Patescibacteria group bacterium]|nr:hypothetical protein [Patescibacteria group bacterium]